MNILPEIEYTLQREGGYVNDPKDPGGETKFGISKKAYPDIDIAALTIEEAGLIYRSDYYDKLRLSKIASLPVRWKVFDIAVNMGRTVASIMLQNAVGARPDGVVGEETIHHANVLLYAGGVRIIMNKLVEDQVKRYARLATRNPDNLKFLLGWIDRAFDRGEVLVNANDAE